MAKYEYRLTWQREGLKRCYKIYQTLKGAENWKKVLTNDYDNNLESDDSWERYMAEIPPLVGEPQIYIRKVEDWKPIFPTQ